VIAYVLRAHQSKQKENRNNAQIARKQAFTQNIHAAKDIHAANLHIIASLCAKLVVKDYRDALLHFHEHIATRGRKEAEVNQRGDASSKWAFITRIGVPSIAR
jgi:hypothetical protein